MASHGAHRPGVATLKAGLLSAIVVGNAATMSCRGDSTTGSGASTAADGASSGGSSAAADAGTSGATAGDAARDAGALADTGRTEDTTSGGGGAGPGGGDETGGTGADTGGSGGGPAAGGTTEPAGGATQDGRSTSGGNSVTTGGGSGGGGGSATGGRGSATGGDSGGGSATGGRGSATGGGGSATGGRGSATGGDSGGGAEIYLSDLCELEDSENGWGPVEKNLSNGEDAENDGGPLSIGGVLYAHGLGTHAPSDIGYALAARCSTLTAAVGVDDEMHGAGSVVFEVWGDGSQLYQSEVKTGSQGPTAIEVDIAGAQELRLVVSDNGGNGSDHADWGDARVQCMGEPLPACVRDPSETPGGPVPTGYALAWSDEFNTEGRPSPDNWTYEHGFVRNNELQWYQEDNATVQGGFLIIDGRKENGSEGGESYNYTSSSLLTRGLHEWQYGRFEMRARIVAAAGLWPAWWTLGVSGEWPSNGEIDIMEYYNNRVHANVACGTSTRWTARWDSADRLVSELGADWDAKFHLWRMDWDSETIALYLDDAEMNRVSLESMLNPDGNSPFRQPHYMIVNLAIGGDAGGDPSATAFPTRYEIDYVRVYRRQ